MARLTHLLTVRKRDGSALGDEWPFDPRQSSVVLAVYGTKDLNARLAVAKDRPDLDVTVREATDEDRHPRI